MRDSRPLHLIEDHPPLIRLMGVCHLSSSYKKVSISIPRLQHCGWKYPKIEGSATYFAAIRTALL